MSTIFCQNCGASNDESSKFCAHCGSGLTIPVSNVSQSQTAQVQNQSYNNSYQNNQNYNNQNYNNYYNQSYANPMYHIDQNDLAAFVGPDNTGYYMQKYNEMNMSNSKASWNWAAFLIAGPWMLYRKMYKNALIFFAIALVSNIVPFLGSMISLALVVCSGIFGNHLYFMHAESQINASHGMDEYQKQAYLRSKGGTSVGAAIGITLAYVFVVCLIIGIVYALGYGYYSYY